jgi:plastocyanin
VFLMTRRFRLIQPGGALLAAALLAAAAQLVQVNPVHAGGGGCSAAPTNGVGVTVEMVERCFNPTVIRVKPGDKVTFVNRDQVQHTVTGTSFRFGSPDTLEPGQSATFKFVTNGVYAYSCIFHPGMTGAVVVGDGTGPGLAAGPDPVVIAPMPASLAAAAPRPPAAPQPPWPWLTVAALVAGGALGFLLSRRIAAPAAS